MITVIGFSGVHTVGAGGAGAGAGAGVGAGAGAGAGAAQPIAKLTASTNTRRITEHLLNTV